MRTKLPCLFVGISALSAAAGCNAIFNITPGSEGGSSTTSSTGGTGGTAGTTGGTGGTAGTLPTGGTGGGCAGGGGPPATGKAYLQRTSASEGSEVGRSIAFDAAGNLFLTGTFTSDQVNLGGGKLPYSNPMTWPAEQGFILKSAPSGDHLASASWSVTGTARTHGIAVDRITGDVVVAGEFIGDLTIGNTTLHSFEQDYNDMFIARLGPDLTPIWAKKFGEIYRQEPEEVAIDSQGNIVVVGATYTMVDFGDGKIGSDDWSAFVVKLSPDGDFIWNQAYDGWDTMIKPDEDNYFNLALAIAPNDDVLVGAAFGQPVFFGPSQAFPKGGRDAYVLRLAAADKALVWKRIFHGGGDESTDGDQWITSLAVDGCGDIYAAGAFTRQLGRDGEAPIPVKGSDPAMADVFLTKLDSAGDITWQKVYGDFGWQEPTAVRADAYGHVALAGFMSDAPGYTGVDFGPGIGLLTPNVPDPGPDFRDDAFVVLLGTDGSGLWGRRVGDASYQAIRSAAFDDKGQLAVTGVFSGAMVLDETQTTLYALGYDMFIGWYDKAN